MGIGGGGSAVNAFISRGLSDLLVGKPSTRTLHAAFSISAAVVARAAAVEIGEPQYGVDGTIQQFRPSFGIPSAHCEKSKGDKLDRWFYLSSKSKSRGKPRKVYNIRLKPLLSAFYPKAILMASIRALLLNYISVLETYMQIDEDELEDETPPPPRPIPDLIEPAKKSVWTTIREITVVTTRRVLERIVVMYVEPRRANKLTKDYFESAVRKAARGAKGSELVTNVCATTFRCQMLGIAAQWIVQVTLDISMAARSLYQRRKDWSLSHDPKGLLKIEVLRVAKGAVYFAVRGVAALGGAAIGAGLGSYMWIGTGTWIGFILGDLAGPHIIGLLLGDVPFFELR